VARRTAAQIYADLTAAGFASAQAVVMTAIALAESSGDDTALGDVGLQDNTWGPSVGLYQVRSLKADTGRGTTRDINWLSGSAPHQAQAAWEISRHGLDFTPWTVYTRGTYQRFLGQAQAAAAGAATGSLMPVADTGGPFPTLGPSWLPWNWPSDVGNSASNRVLGGVRTIVVEGLAVVLGVGLVGLGLARAIRGRGR
jgi:hypothetical protein